MFVKYSLDKAVEAGIPLPEGRAHRPSRAWPRDLSMSSRVWQAMPLLYPDRLSGIGLESDYGTRLASYLGGSGGAEEGLALTREAYRAPGLGVAPG